MFMLRSHALCSGRRSTTSQNRNSNTAQREKVRPLLITLTSMRSIDYPIKMRGWLLSNQLKSTRAPESWSY